MLNCFRVQAATSHKRPHLAFADAGPQGESVHAIWTRDDRGT